MQNGLVAALLAASAFLLCQVAVASDKVPELGVHHGSGEPLKVGGGRVPLHNLGPTIVTPEGHLRRIKDWDQLPPGVQSKARVRIHERNQERLAALREKVRLEDMHDSTLRIDDEKVTKSAEELEAHRRLQLENFVEGLENLKKATGGAGLPGFGSSFLKDPRFADDKPIDVNALTEQLEKLKNHHKDKSKQQGPLGVHDDL